jgi:hypothetical protein
MNTNKLSLSVPDETGRWWSEALVSIPDLITDFAQGPARESGSILRIDSAVFREAIAKAGNGAPIRHMK